MFYPPSKITIFCAFIMIILLVSKKPGYQKFVWSSFFETAKTSNKDSNQGGGCKPSTPYEIILAKLGDCRVNSH